METLGWQASVAGLLFQELFLSHRLPLGRRGRKGGRREDDQEHSVPPRAQEQSLLLGFKSFIEVQLIYNVVSISALPQSDSVI